MKVVLVTSAVTFVPRNYYDALAGALLGAREHIHALILLENFEMTLLAKSVGLWALGCRNFGSSLLRNCMSSLSDSRPRLFASEHKQVLRAKSMNDPSILQWINQNKIDLIINMRTRCIFKKEILRSPRLGCVNVHHGLLPENRGTMCDLYAMAENQPAGFSLHVMNEKIDAGAILHRETVRGANHDGSRDYLDYLGQAAIREGEILANFIQQVARADRLPEGLANHSNSKVYRRNPTRHQIREMQSQGVIL